MIKQPTHFLPAQHFPLIVHHDEFGSGVLSKRGLIGMLLAAVRQHLPIAVKGGGQQLCSQNGQTRSLARVSFNRQSIAPSLPLVIGITQPMGLSGSPSLFWLAPRRIRTQLTEANR
jgi:hypothetical protein